METKQDVTDQSAIKNEQKQVNVVPPTISCFASDRADAMVLVSVYKRAMAANLGCSQITDIPVSRVKKLMEKWFSMYNHYLSQKFVNERKFFSDPWFQYWLPFFISLNFQNVSVRWCYPTVESYQLASDSANSLVRRDSKIVSCKNQLPWRCRSQNKSLEAFKFFQNYNLRGQKTLVFKKRESEPYTVKYDQKCKDQGYKYAQNLNNSISRRVTTSRANCTRNRSGENPYYELCDSYKTYKPTQLFAKPKRQPRSYMDGDDQRNDIREPCNYNLLRKQSFKIEPPVRKSPPEYHEKTKTEANMRKHPVQLLCELYGKNGLQIECEFICSTPFRKQKVTYTVMGRKFTAISHTRDEAKRLCAKKVLMTLHPELHHELQEEIPRREYDFGYRLNRRHPVDLVNYLFKNEAVLIETEKKGLSHFTSYTVYYTVRGKRYVATAEKQNEAKRRCAILVLNDLYRSNDHYK